MTIHELIQKSSFKVVEGQDHLQREIHGVYVSDLLSDVIGKTQPDQLWLTIQGHSNIVAVALLKDLSAIILTGDNRYDALAIKKAKEEDVVLLTTELPTYESACILYQLGIR